MTASAPDTPSALDAFVTAARESPDRDAILYFDARISYAKLDAWSSGLARRLRAAGFAPGDRLALFLQNSPHFIIAMLAAWKLGGTVMPINPMNRARELALLLDDARPHTLIVAADLYPRLFADLPAQGWRPEVVLRAAAEDFQTTDDARVMPQRVTENPALPPTMVSRLGGDDIDEPFEAITTDAPAYLVYTSGTSGRPKGVMISHANVLAGVAVNRNAFAVDNDTRIVALAPLFHVTGLMSQINLAASVAAPLILTYRFEPSLMAETIASQRATHMIGAITAFTAMINAPGANSYSLQSIRVAGSGGAPVPAAALEVVERFIGTSLQIGYGMTETTIATHITPRGEAIPVDPHYGVLSVGKPSPGVTAWIMRDDGSCADPGETGEIIVSGPTISLGYWDNAEETAKVFASDGLRTGDVGFCDPDCWLFLVDRKKDMISASGFKVWPREVEDILYSHPAVREAAVVGINDPYRGETVAAAVSLRDGANASEEDLLRLCREQLAPYKVPRRFALLDEIPKNASGKILRSEIRALMDEPSP